MEIQFLHQITFTFFSTIASILLAAFSLFKPPPNHSDEPTTAAASHVVIFDTSSSSVLRVPIHVVTTFIKKKVPIIPYSDSAHRHGGDHTAMCMVCLEGIDASNPIRELLGCDHVFHRECLDTWIDVRQVTCPLCRSMILPLKKLVPYAKGLVA